MSRHLVAPAYIPAVGDSVEVHEDATPRTGTVTALLHCGRVEVACRDSRRQVLARLCRLIQKGETK